jgi:dTDP-4-dehydrorhamnose 3,5-epimerase
MIEGLQVIDLQVNVDDRGYLIEIARRTGELHRHGVVFQFGQVYLVGNFTRGTIRAFHKHKFIWDYFFISHGAAKFIFYDDRQDSPTYQKMQTEVISSRKPKLIVVPPGVYHGWMSLEDDTQLVSIASETYNFDNPDEVRIPFDSFGDVWSVKPR